MSHVPERTCVTCRARRPKTELLRVVRAPDGSGALLDARQRMPGRGAYLCLEPGCWHAGAMKRGLERTLRTPVSAAARQELSQALIKGAE